MLLFRHPTHNGKTFMLVDIISSITQDLPTLDDNVQVRFNKYNQIVFTSPPPKDGNCDDTMGFNMEPACNCTSKQGPL